MRIQCSGYAFTGIITKGCDEGTFKNEFGYEYTGQIKNNAAHGKGTRIGSYFDGDDTGEWVDGWLTGYGERIFKEGAIYHGQFENGSMHGYGQKASDKCESQGQWVQNVMQGPMRVLTNDGNVKYTIWEKNKDTGVPCDADDFVGKANEGTFLSTYLPILPMYIPICRLHT